ncbi:MAG: MFS transporter [Candidatus Dormibacteraeota bacterium]|nr:MFS transporter [Candidatus Dormibacteraeota bacterium]
MSERDVLASPTAPRFQVPAGSPDAPTDEERDWVTGLHAELRQHRPVALGALLAATTLLRVGAVGTGVVVALYLTDLAGGRPSGVVIGLVAASQAMSEMLFAPFLARMADRVGRSWFIVGGPLVAAVGVLLVAISTGAAHVGAARLLEGIGAAAFVPTALGTIAAATVRDRSGRARASGAFDAATLAGYAGGFAAGPFAYHSLQRGAFVVLAGLYVLAGLICLWLVPRVAPLPVSPIRTVLSAVFGRGPMRSFLPAWVGVFVLISAFSAHMPAILRHSVVPGQALMHHFDERLIGVLLVGGIVMFLVGIALWTPLLARSRPTAIMLRALPGAVLILGALDALNHIGLGLAPIALPLVALGIVWLAGFGPAAVTYLADCSENLIADRSALMSFYTVTLAGGSVIGAVLGGVAWRSFQADGLLAFVFVVFLVTYVFTVRLSRLDATSNAGLFAAPAGG